ncbi:hypothetical protein I7I51_08424 [Histoplasma capsulatum]|uniref:Uncharacterized protein n=1 Tax=Ajellomyces capsulatus TaxID=5037 RepID=A0A8A1M3H6_AJECA|nr:hypothetical protein I7I51_08424 [Histoplasma capsulatum]
MKRGEKHNVHDFAISTKKSFSFADERQNKLPGVVDAVRCKQARDAAESSPQVSSISALLHRIIDQASAMLATSNLFLQGDIQPIVIVGHFLTTPKLSPDALMWNSTPERSSNAKAERLKLTLLARPLCKLSGQSENDAQCGND